MGDGAIWGEERNWEIEIRAYRAFAEILLAFVVRHDLKRHSGAKHDLNKNVR